jgi:hypothetical protein
MQKLSKAEAGALGIAKSRKTINELKQKRIDEYNNNPSICKCCNKSLSYKNRKKIFCNHTCSAIFNNKQRSEIVKWNCYGCGKEHNTLPYKVKKYCNHSCQNAKIKEDSFERLKQGLISDRSLIRNILKREFGNKCFECELETWRGYPIPLEVDHIDGNAGNNTYLNLRLICPNCHSITPTWKGRNKGNGRAARGLPLN